MEVGIFRDGPSCHHNLDYFWCSLVEVGNSQDGPSCRHNLDYFWCSLVEEVYCNNLVVVEVDMKESNL